jgi:hypothetical protein
MSTSITETSVVDLDVVIRHFTHDNGDHNFSTLEFKTSVSNNRWNSDAPVTTGSSFDLFIYDPEALVKIIDKLSEVKDVLAKRY